MEQITTALIQLNSGADVKDNLDRAEELIRQAASQGATFILTPENTAIMAESRASLFAASPEEANHPAVKRFSALANELDIWLLLGSVSVKAEDAADRLYNRSLLFDPSGEIAARYDKIHLYDVEVEGGESHKESNNFAYGTTPSIAQAPFGNIGLSICYDVRFAYLYRHLAHKGAHILTVPSAFTHFTGSAHWHTLLKARAIEHGCFVLAPGQCGHHPKNRRTYGHSLIIDPWGDVLAEGSEETEEVVMATLHMKKVEEVRRQLPVLMHDRPL